MQYSWLPCAQFAGLDAEPLVKGSLYATIEGRYGVRIMRARQLFTAIAACEPEAALLDLEPGSPLLRITRTTYDGANRPIEFAMSAMRPGAPIETMMERASAQPRRERAPAGQGLRGSRRPAGPRAYGLPGAPG